MLAVCGCALRPGESTRVNLDSRDADFLDDLAAPMPVAERRVHGWLLLPESAKNPYPAVVLLHSSIGQGSQDWHYAEAFRDMGLAVLAVDSFTPRGVRKTVEDQTLVSEASMMADAFAALRFLGRHPSIDRERIAVVGFSKGGAPALLAAFERYHRALGDGEPPFALHIAYYPWCGVRLLDVKTTGAPVLIHSGALDTVTPAHLCREFIDEVAARDPEASMELIVYDEARHAFDHPMLRWFSWVPAAGRRPEHCLIREVRPNVFVETHSGIPVHRGSLRAALDACSGGAPSAGGNPEAARLAFERTRAALRTALLE